MFSGLVDHKGQIIQSIGTPKGRRLTIQSQFNDIQLGESIAVDGVCLTAVEPQEGLFSLELSPETLAVTTFGLAEIGTEVNLERSLRVGDRLGGHFVSGHVDTIATVTQLEPQAEYLCLSFAFEGNRHKSLMVQKGSIAVNGVSLTINSVSTNGFSVMLIPHTLKVTNLAALKVGARVNIEFDMLVKMVVNVTEQRYNETV